MTQVIQAPEWAPHAAVWIGFPSHPDLWLEDLDPARAEVVAFARAVHAGGKGERVILVATDETSAAAAREMAGDAAEVIVEAFGDIWLRDSAPIIVGTGAARQAIDFGFNWWGGKYELPGDESIGARLAARSGFPTRTAPWVFEGGAIDSDGTGLAVTTEQCLLNPNRNPDLDRNAIEGYLQRDLGFSRVLWLGDGLLNDHTDGHVDNLARFVAPNRLAVPRATGPNDPNAAIYADAAARARDAGVDVVEVPSPGLVEWGGMVQPASYMNFVIASDVVIVPVFGTVHDDDGVAAIAELFPGRATIGLMADAVLAGGGGFHCSSQQMPSA